MQNHVQASFVNAPLQLLASLHELRDSVLTLEPTPNEVMAGLRQPLCEAFRALLWNMRTSRPPHTSTTLEQSCRAATAISADQVGSFGCANS